MIRGMEATTGLEQMICFELYAASRAMTALYRPALDAAGLTYPQYLVMRVLWHRGPTTVRDLGAAIHLDSGTLSPLLKRLETAGRIRRERGTTDERTVWIHLTPDGTALQDQLAGLPAQIACATGLTLDEFGQLHTLLTRITPR
ncbi:MarR family winged helix-turn-helix transcriptional regulator [Actinoplanes sp. NPDC051513]|uniref:MarR family winged helix-turn-helix transcriptional regulator n=1 Tax=Actinoplanes sp. NPDC051513 TaxID=3363908 RepID=UPI0037930A1A